MIMVICDPDLNHNHVKEMNYYDKNI